jgi:hypothetical protein
MSFDVNVYGSLLPLVLGMSTLESIPLNLDQVQSWSFEIVIDYLKIVSITPHLSNEVMSLDYNKIKVQNVSSFPITFNNNIIFELSPMHLPIGHYGQMQGMDCKYDGHPWCKVKTSNIENNSGLGFKNP